MIERAIIASILSDPGLLADAEGRLSAADFESPALARLWESAQALQARGASITLHSLAAEAGSDIGPLAEIEADLPDTSAFNQYVDRLLSVSTKRKLGIALDRILAEDRPGLDICVAVEEAAHRLATPLIRSDLTPLATAMPALIDYMESPDRRPGVSTGIATLDAMMQGLLPGRLITVAARTGKGKSAFAFNNLGLTAARAGTPVAAFSLEMSKHELGQRMLAADTGVSVGRMRTGQLDAEDWRLIVPAAKALSQLPIWIDDSAERMLGPLAARIRRFHREHPGAVYVVDYLGLLHAEGDYRGQRYLEVGEITGRLKQLARVLPACIVAVHQLNRKPDERADSRPRLSDLRESGSVEQDSDQVILIHRADDGKDSVAPTEAELIVAKNRHGPIGSATVYFDPLRTKFLSGTRR